MKNYYVQIEVDDSFSDDNDLYESEISQEELSIENLYAAFESVLLLFGYSEDDITQFYNNQTMMIGEN